MGAEEVGTSDAGVWETGSVLLDIGDVLYFGGAGGFFIWVGDAGYVPVNRKELGQIPLQGVPHTGGAATAEGTGWDVGVPPAGRGYGGGSPVGGGDLCRPPLEHIRTVYFYRAHYGPVPGGGATNRYKGIS